MATGDPMWACPFCGRVYYAANQTACNCGAWMNFSEKVAYDPTKYYSTPIIEMIPLSEVDKQERRRKTLVVNLFAGPGAGKSSTRAGIFYELKKLSIECEEAPEFAKDLVWEKRDFTFENQIYLFGKQHHRIFRLLGQVAVVITDCPLLLSAIYDGEHRETFEKLIVEEHQKMWTYNVIVRRVKPYNPKGRLKTHSDKVAREIDVEVANLLDKHNIPFEVFDGNHEGLQQIVQKIKLIINYAKAKTPTDI